MDLQDFNRLHWLVIGAVVGGLLSYSRLYDLASGKRVTPEDRVPSQTQIITDEELLAELRRSTGEGNTPQQADLTIYPQIDQRSYVAGKVFRRNTEGIESYRDILAISSTSSTPTGDISSQANRQPGDAIAELARSNPRIKYHTAWWAAPAATVGLWCGGSILTLGVVWPALIGFAVGAGILPKRPSRAERKREADYLVSFNSNKDGQLQPEMQRAAHTDDGQLATLTEKLELNLKSAAPSSTENPSLSQRIAAPIRKLESSPLEASNAGDTPKEDVNWGGEFYPVAHPKPHSTD